jgi:hypothetical protein
MTLSRMMSFQPGTRIRFTTVAAQSSFFEEEKKMVIARCCLSALSSRLALPS